MAALLAVLTFAFFVTLDYVISRPRARQEAASGQAVPAAAAVPEPTPAVEPVWVAGYQMPDNLYYHVGHTWARVLGPDTVAVGIDDFARRLVGKASRVKLPAVGNWLRQGQSSASVCTNGRCASVVSPVEGEVVEVNRELRAQPARATQDPYGSGWLFKIRSAALVTNLRNLLNGTTAKRWMEDARSRLEVQLMALSGSVLQDGGEPSPDFADHLEDGDWKHLVESFLLTH